MVEVAPVLTITPVVMATDRTAADTGLTVFTLRYKLRRVGQTLAAEAEALVRSEVQPMAALEFA